MRPTLLLGISAIALSATLWLPAPLIAQDHSERGELHRYKLIDLGTFGGPHSYGSTNGDGSRMLNNAGVVTSFADTATPDPNAPDHCFVPDCLIAHAFRWRHGRLKDLGALDDSLSSIGSSINARGWVAGLSQTGLFDPVFGIAQNHAVLWKGRRILDLDTLPGGSESFAISINNAGQVVGFSDNGIPDPFAQFFFPSTTQVRAFLWEHGNMEDIGTLGGPDSFLGPGCDNQRPGVIVGSSFTSYTANTSTGVPNLDPFLWDNGTMTDLGNLGGTLGLGQCVNARGEVIGISDLSGELVTHAFRWRNGRMKDLGTLGGPNSQAIWINDAGDIVGSADLPTPGLHDAVIWRHGHIHDLGTVPGDACSGGKAINSRGQVVGLSSDCRNALHAFVWEEGGPMRDLNKLIAPGSGLQLTNAFNINDRGEILAKSFPVGTTPHDDADLGHLVLLIPCDKDDHDGDCSDDDHADAAVAPTDSAPATTQATVSTQTQHPLTATGTAAAWRARLAHRFRAPGARRE
jgi:probable HAF family extracellular repeat protein